ncbi:hypothetical protein GOP47_0003689 [Adiantum capillus-veneris]|uniref:Uncharacterized protein n=1 Tax=Adiantum capillus-veneris TaxID=13818 RepID=A0A9D4V639_ADICA|nr:hypothetical protein GOP47_0003689 [Adiantum capillus-veneris]
MTCSLPSSFAPSVLTLNTQLALPPSTTREFCDTVDPLTTNCSLSSLQWRQLEVVQQELQEKMLALNAEEDFCASVEKNKENESHHRAHEGEEDEQKVEVTSIEESSHHSSQAVAAKQFTLVALLKACCERKDLNDKKWLKANFGHVHHFA